MFSHHLEFLEERNKLPLLFPHSAVVCLDAWPLNESEAGADLVLIEPPCFCYVNDAVIMLISRIFFSFIGWARNGRDEGEGEG